MSFLTLDLPDGPYKSAIREPWPARPMTDWWMAPAEPCARTFVRSRLGTLRRWHLATPLSQPRPRCVRPPGPADLLQTITDVSA